MSVKTEKYELYNSDFLGNHSINIRVLQGEDAGIIVTFDPKRIEQMLDFLYNDVWSENGTSN